MRDAASRAWEGGEARRVYLTRPPRPGGKGKEGEREVNIIHAELVAAPSH